MSNPLLPPEELRSQFPLTKDYAYFNTAASGLVPQSTIAAMQDYWHRQAHPNGLGLPDSGPEGEGAEARMARFIGAFESEVTFVTNTSHAISIAATSLPLGPGDEVIIPEREFPAVVYPFLYAAGLRGFAVRFARWRGYGPSPEDLEASMTTNTKVLCMSWVSSTKTDTRMISLRSARCAGSVA